MAARRIHTITTAPGTALSTGAWLPLDRHRNDVRVGVAIVDATTTAADLDIAIEFSMEDYLGSGTAVQNGLPLLSLSTAGASAFTTAVKGGFGAVRLITGAVGGVSAQSSQWHFFVQYVGE